MLVSIWQGQARALYLSVMSEDQTCSGNCFILHLNNGIFAGWVNLEEVRHLPDPAVLQHHAVSPDLPLDDIEHRSLSIGHDDLVIF